MKRPLKKLISFLSAAAMLCELPLLPAGASYVAEQIGSDYAAMLRMKNQDVFIESGTVENPGAQLVVIGSDGKKTLVDLASDASLYPFASRAMLDYNFLSPTPSAYSFDFFDPTFQIGSDQDVIITQTKDGYALMDLTGKLVSKSYPALSYMGAGFFITRAPITSAMRERAYEEDPDTFSDAYRSEAGVITTDGTEIFAPGSVEGVWLTMDGKNFLVHTKDGDYFTDLTGKKVGETYKSIRSAVTSEYQWKESESGQYLQYIDYQNVQYQLDSDVYLFTNEDEKTAASFHGIKPETDYADRVYYNINSYYDASDPDSVSDYLSFSQGDSTTYYDMDGNQLDESPGSKEEQERQAYWSKRWEEEEAERQRQREIARIQFVDTEGKDFPEEYQKKYGFQMGDTVYYTAQAEGYFTVFDSELNVIVDKVNGYLYPYSEYDTSGFLIWYTDQEDGWRNWRDENAEPAHYGIIDPAKAAVTEPIYGKPQYVPENSHFYVQHDKAVAVLDWDGAVLHEFSDNYNFASVTRSAYELMAINGTDAATGKPTSVVYDAIKDEVKFEQTGKYDKITQVKDTALVVTNYDEKDASLWTDDSVFSQGLIQYDGTEVITPSNDMYIILDSYLRPVTDVTFTFVLDTDAFSANEAGTEKLFAVIRNHKNEYTKSSWRNNNYEGVYVDVDTLDPAYAADHGVHTAAKLSDGNFAVVKDGKWGLSKASGEAIIEPVYDAIYEYHNGLALAVNYGEEPVEDETSGNEKGTQQMMMPHVGVIDNRGNELVEPFYDITLDTGRGIRRPCAVRLIGDTIYTRNPTYDENNRVEYHTFRHDEVFNEMTEKYGYDTAAAYGDFWIVTKDGLTGIVTSANKTVIPVEYTDVLYFTADQFTLAKVNSQLGTVLSDESYTSPFRKLDDGSCLVSVRKKDGKISVFRIQDDGSADVEPGDVSGDGAVNASDAAQILIAAASLGAGKDSGLTAEQKAAADVNGDGAINASDAAIVLMYAAAVGGGNTDAKLSDFVH